MFFRNVVNLQLASWRYIAEDRTLHMCFTPTYCSFRLTTREYVKLCQEGFLPQFRIHYLLIILQFDTLQSEVLEAQ
jgi:hypothetical protein